MTEVTLLWSLACIFTGLAWYRYGLRKGRREVRDAALTAIVSALHEVRTREAVATVGSLYRVVDGEWTDEQMRDQIRAIQSETREIGRQR